MAHEDYRQLVRIAAELRPQGFLRAYKNDLVEWDKKALKDHQGPYLWAIRENGTHLLTPEGACYGINHGKAWRNLPRTFSGPLRVYFSRGGGARPKAISVEAAGKVAQKWEDKCKVRRSLWTGEPV